MNDFTIVISDNDLLSCICGTNDSNLRLIEENLGVPVFTHGNELYINSCDSELCEKFQFIFDRISDEIHDDGMENCDEIILSVLNAGRKKDDSSSSILVSGSYKKIYPRTENQAKYINLLQTKDMVFCAGASGSGKTFLAVAEALRLILNHSKKRLIITRPVVEAGESLGFLPGDLTQKIDPFLKPLRDAMEMIVPPETVRKLTESGIIEIAPLAYMRGRTLNNAVIILDEAQNTTKSQMKMFLTRMGENSKIFITGDSTQIDLPKKEFSGLLDAMNLLYKIEDIGFITLGAEDVVRHPLVQKIVKAYENEKKC